MIKSIITTIQRLISRYAKILMWILSILFAIFLLIQIAIIGAVIWFNSDNGQAFIQNQLKAANQHTGYIITFDKISYALLRGLEVQNFAVKDDDGLILDINAIIMKPNIMGLGMRYFGLSMIGDQLTIHRLPQSQQAADKETKPFGMDPIILPDLYFTSIGIDQLSFETLHIQKDVFGTDLFFSPSLSGHISIGDIIDFKMDLKVRHSDIAWMPKRASLNGTFNPTSLNVTIADLIIKNNYFMMNANGDANIGNDAHVDIKTTLAVHDFQPFAKDVEGQAEIEATLKGPMDAPALQSSGHISMPMLKDYDIDQIAFTITDDNVSMAPLGHATISTQYKDQPASISATFDIKDDHLFITSINGEAPDLTMKGDVDIDMANILANGKIQLDAPILSTYSTMVKSDIAGQASATITLLNDNALQKININANVQNGQYDTIQLGKADIAAHIADIQNPWPNSITVNAQNISLPNDVMITSLTSDLMQQNNDDYLLSLMANGQGFEEFNIKGKAVLNGLRQSNINANDIALTLSSSKGSSITLDGTANKDQLDISLHAQDFPLSALPIGLPNQMRDLNASADAHISGQMAKPLFTATANLKPIQIAKKSRIQLSAKATYKNNLAQINLSGTGDAIDTLNGSIRLPITLSLNPFIIDMPSTTPLDGTMTIDAQAQSLASIILPVGHILKGDVNAHATILGTIGKPDIAGVLTLANGTYWNNAYGVKLFDIGLDANLTRDMIEIKTLTANDGRDGTLSGHGRINFMAQQNTKLTLALDDFKLLDSDKAKGTMSADLDLQGTAKSYRLSGDLTLGEWMITIPERFEKTIPQLNIVKKHNEDSQANPLNNVQLDITVVANDKIFVRGWGLDAEFGGKINVDGRLDNPQLNGVFQSRRGRYEEFGRRFTLDRALINFQGTVPPSPYLDILATTDADDIQASVHLEGELNAPSITLSSVPSLPQDEVMSRILFGKNLTNITPFQAIQLKQTLDRFTGKGGSGFDAIGKLRNVTGLDDIRVDTNDNGETSIGVGKYITDKVYLELEKGSGEETGAAKIQVEVTPNINLESQVGQDAEAGGAILWRWDY